MIPPGRRQSATRLPANGKTGWHAFDVVLNGWRSFIVSRAPMVCWVVAEYRIFARLGARASCPPISPAGETPALPVTFDQLFTFYPFDKLRAGFCLLHLH